MALPAPRDLPVTVATWSDIRRCWLVALPGGVTLPAPDEQDVEDLVRRYAYGSAISFVRPGADTSRGRWSAPSVPATEAEDRFGVG